MRPSIRRGSCEQLIGLLVTGIAGLLRRLLLRTNRAFALNRGSRRYTCEFGTGSPSCGRIRDTSRDLVRLLLERIAGGPQYELGLYEPGSPVGMVPYRVRPAASTGFAAQSLVKPLGRGLGRMVNFPGNGYPMVAGGRPRRQGSRRATSVAGWPVLSYHQGRRRPRHRRGRRGSKPVRNWAMPAVASGLGVTLLPRMAVATEAARAGLGAGVRQAGAGADDRAGVAARGGDRRGAGAVAGVIGGAFAGGRASRAR